MKMRFLLNSIAVTCAVIMTGCGVIKAREDRVVRATQTPGGERGASVGPGNAPDPEDESIRQIKQFLDLYSDHGAVTRDGLANFFEKYKDKIAPFLAGLHMSAQELVDLVFQFDANHDGHVTPQELSDGLMKRIPILRWIPDNVAAITREELEHQIALEYPQASQTARTGLGEVLMRFDEKFAEGNADGKLSRTEASGAGLVLGVLAQTDFSKGFTIPPGVIAPIDGNAPGTGAGHSHGPDGSTNIDVSPLVGKLVQQKLDQQLFTRYTVHSSQELSQDDLRLEWMQLALKFFLADKLVHHFGLADGANAGKLAENGAASALSAWGIPQLPHWSALRKIYDNAMTGGDGDGYFNSIETFNYLTDLEFAHKVRAFVHGDFSARSLSANPSKRYFLAVMLKLLPRTGEALLLNDLDAGQLAQWGVRSEYWNGFGQFDRGVEGGNADGVLDDGETAMALLHAKLVENLYELFDTNHDTYLVRAEGNRLFAALGITDSRIIDAFYADIGLDSDSPNFWAKLRLFFSGDHGWKWLRPYDFHVRIVQVLPRLLNKNGEEL